MRRCLSEYHVTVVRDLVGDRRPADRWIHEIDYHKF